MRIVNKNANYLARINTDEFDGEYLSGKQYMDISLSLGLTHVFLELFYIWLGCTPMAFINIASILSYVFCIFLNKKGYNLASAWVMEIEIFLHVIFACIFLGLKCGYQLWLFGTFSSIFLPFFTPEINKTPKKQIGIYVFVVFLGFEIITYLDIHGFLPTVYRVNDNLAHVLYYINAAVGFISITAFSSVYNKKMTLKNEKLKYLADYDMLTDMFNRQKIHQILHNEIIKAQKTSDYSMAIAILDVDHFKKINDTYGHLAGDQVLKDVSKCINLFEERELIYGRWGGEEFLLISPASMKYEDYGKMLDDIRRSIEQKEFYYGNRLIKVTVSIGAAEYSSDMDADKLLQKADERLYTAKETGRNKVIY